MPLVTTRHSFLNTKVWQQLPAHISPWYYHWRPGGNQFVAPFLPTLLTAPGSSRILLLFGSRTICKFPLFMLLNKLGQKSYHELSSNKLKKRWKKLSASVEEKRPYFSLTPVPEKRSLFPIRLGPEIMRPRCKGLFFHSTGTLFHWGFTVALPLLGSLRYHDSDGHENVA